jgi:Mlc titration factor MtfA (ptsG expression regulator)
MLRWLIVLLAIALVSAGLWLHIQKVRARAAASGLTPQDCRRILELRLPVWAKLPEDLRQALIERLQSFLDRVPFTGAHDFVVSDDMRVVVGAQACLITLGHDDYPFEALHGITLHADEFVVAETLEDEDTGVVTEGYRALSGQAIESERIVLSWRDVEESLLRSDGYNVVIHEFTHYLEQTHPGGDRSAHAALAQHLDELRAAVDRGEQTLLDPYAAEDLTEFLAVAAEFFFERPSELLERHPVLYVVLRDSFKLDPATWRAPVALAAPTDDPTQN